MSSNFLIQRICQHCNKEFTARTTVTKYFSPACNKRAFKDGQRNSKIEVSNQQTLEKKLKPINELKAKEYLTVKEVATSSVTIQLFGKLKDYNSNSINYEIKIYQ